MATEIYKINFIYLTNGEELEISPLKIKYLRRLMEKFEDVKNAKNDYETITELSICAMECMKQFKPEIATSIEKFEEFVDLKTIYKLLDFCAGIKIDKDSEESVKKQAVDSGSSWDDLDLAQLESEVFLLGIWKDYDELEKSLSMPELTAVLNVKREEDYAHKKFLAAMQGVDLDEGNKSNAWEEMKARVFSGGQSSDPNDIIALQGQNAANAGFGIGMGLNYERID
jgi:translation initiation factor 1 (eIF-1/SUI1)